MPHKMPVAQIVALGVALSFTVLSGCVNSPGLLIDPPLQPQAIPQLDKESTRRHFRQASTYSDDHCRRAGYQSRANYEMLLTQHFFDTQKLDPQWIPIASKSQVRVGMPSEVVRFAWGDPSSTGLIHSEYTNIEYWHYHGSNYQTTTLSFENGSLSSIIR